METKKTEIYNLLASTGYTVYQERPEIIESFPSITFRITRNVAEYSLDRSIGRQNVEVAIDLWARNSSETSQMLVDVEAVMISNDYVMSGNYDIPDEVSHISLLFNY